MTTLQDAKEVFGKDFLHPDEIAQAYHEQYDAGQMRKFEKTLPSISDLRELHEEGYLLLPGPPHPMSLLQIRDTNAKFFQERFGGWFADPSEVFASRDVVLCRWLALRKEAIPMSHNLSWEEQTEALPSIRLVPNAAEAAWCIMAYKRLRGANLFRDRCIRTRSYHARGRCVNIGDFNGSGLYVDDLWGDLPASFIGIAPLVL